MAREFTPERGILILHYLVYKHFLAKYGSDVYPNYTRSELLDISIKKLRILVQSMESRATKISN